MSGNAPATTLEQPAPVTPGIEEIVQDEQELAAKGLDAWTPPSELPPEVEQRVQQLAPQPPPDLREEDAQRWAMSSRIATLIAIDQFADEPDAELRKFAWSAARSIFRDREKFPMDDPPAGPKKSEVPAVGSEGLPAGNEGQDGSGLIPTEGEA